MQLNKIQELIAQYKTCLEKDSAFQQRNLYKWESLKIWKDNWDTEALNFQKMFDASLQNSITRRIWSREYYAPKQMMLIFIGLQPEFVRLMFRELFNEDKAMEYRADRFVFYCDTLMETYKEQQKKPIENTHFHEGYEMISYYLSFQFPEHYAPYYFTNFQRTLSMIGSKDIPLAHDLSRHFKVAKILHNFLKKDEVLLSLHQRRLQSIHYQKETLLLVDDFTDFLCTMI